MKNKGIIIFLLILAVVIVAVIAGDYLSGRPDRAKPNPFSYDVSEFREVDPSLIIYRETKQFNPGFAEPAALAITGDTIYVAGDGRMKVIDLAGGLIAEFSLAQQPRAVAVDGDALFVAADRQVFVYDLSGNQTDAWQALADSSLITSIAAHDDRVFIADAGQRRVIRYNRSGEVLGTFDGRASDDALHGFIIPSACFDLAINDEEELWVVNPGLHTLQNYTLEGHLRRHWKSSGIRIDGFSGCCNPSHFAFLSDGRFVTSEKGLVRIKVYHRSGEFEGVVAAPVRFTEGGRAPEVAADSRDHIYALDFDRKRIRLFEPAAPVAADN